MKFFWVYQIFFGRPDNWYTNETDQKYMEAAKSSKYIKCYVWVPGQE